MIEFSLSIGNIGNYIKTSIKYMFRNILKKKLPIKPIESQLIEETDPVNKDAKIKRYHIINALIQKNNYTRYLEIGVRNPDECFNFIMCDQKTSVDPGAEGDYIVDFKLTSDEFFAKNSQKFDIIFIDGLHIDDQVKTDIKNSLNTINPNGTIVLHDCNPPSLHHAREDYYDFNTPATVYWNGTVWKAIADFKASSHANKFSCHVVNTDWGIGIIQASENAKPIINDNPFYAFRKFEQNREYYIGLISIEKFVQYYLEGDNSLLPNQTAIG